MSAQCTNQVVTVPDAKQLVPKLITSKEQNLQNYIDVFEHLGCFPGSPYDIQIDQSVTPKQTSSTNPNAFERSFPARNLPDAQSGSPEAST